MGKRGVGEIIQRVWWGYVDEDLQQLFLESTVLIEKVASWREKFNDYAFVVFPAAKAYEGFLKSLFLDLGFITREEYYGKRLRVGRILNPSLDRNMYAGESVYDKMVEFCSGKELADELWVTWKEGRNLLFHWFPNEKNAISFEEAKDRVEKILNTMDFAYRECKIKRNPGE